MAHGVEVTRDRLAAFPSDALTVLAEHSSIFYDLMVDDVVQLLFAKGAFAQLQPYFRYLHFTTEHMSDMVPSGRQPKPVGTVAVCVCVLFTCETFCHMPNDQLTVLPLCLCCLSSLHSFWATAFHSSLPFTHSQLLRFSFNLPSANNNMADIARLLQAVMLFIDVVGQYKLGPEQLKRGAKARGMAFDGFCYVRHAVRALAHDNT